MSPTASPSSLAGRAGAAGRRLLAARGGGAAAIRVMIVDDSLTVRTIFKRMVESDPALVIVGTASSAEGAIAQLAEQPADVVLLDLEMPGMGGLEALPVILATPASPQVLVVSSLTVDGAEHTLSALRMGAADTLLKPRPGGFTEDYRSQLLGKIRALGARNAGGGGEAAAGAADLPMRSFARVPAAALPRLRRVEAVAIGASTGGIHALGLMLGALGPGFDLPILITQHLPPSFIPVFARQIEHACGRPADIAADGSEIRAGRIMIAPGRGHMLVRRSGEKLVTRISTDPAPSGCLPSVDPMLTSLAAACEGRVLGVILSGMGRDGALGAADLVDAGGTIYAQDADSSAVWGMPGAVARAGLASLIAPPSALGEAITAQISAAPLRRQG
ncbi:MAG: chemotaxis-specific protein-glutamate methyltransferase CheB [Erythrobacter sp.]|uniref:chemotaxis-specific protein-glutamate methyltransferase CheB n=1 Tax=Erythrobacter sp. TaxID=1042 RepID=UPI002B45CF6D|nr:chemotaxis-specific protein-glutamate methyltransferase CheB [Erythrobacter sp.]WRH71872.1 MAG: chemotaxis-specific protein-glutamate methyltransferase CheB [Erythrobacter sp.]